MKQPFSISPSRWAAILACPLPMLMACGPATVVSAVLRASLMQRLPLRTPVTRRLRIRLLETGRG